MTDTHTLAYLAGILDGEGSFSVILHKPYRRHIPLVGVMNTDRRLMDWLLERFGGVVYHRTSPSNKTYWKARFEWRLSQTGINLTLPAVLPFLVIKREQAEQIIKLRSTFGNLPRNTRLPEDIFQEREAVRQTIIALNDRRSRMNLGCRLPSA